MTWLREHGLWLIYLGSACFLSWLFGRFTNEMLQERFGVFDPFWLGLWNVVGGGGAGYMIGFFAAKLWRWSRGG